VVVVKQQEKKTEYFCSVKLNQLPLHSAAVARR
jgi:hypothetical protein